jgi:hypothetical protein
MYIMYMIHMVLVQLYRHTGLTQSKCTIERPVHTYVLKRPGQLHRNVVQEASSLAGLEAREASWRFGASNLVTSMLEPEVDIGYGKVVERCRTIFFMLVLFSKMDGSGLAKSPCCESRLLSRSVELSCSAPVSC